MMKISLETVKMYLFSYGSNNTQQLAQRTASKNLVPIGGYIQDYVRIFAGYSIRREGGVASIYPARGKRVYGSLVVLTAKQLTILDKYEKGYDRVVMKVNVSPTETVDSWVYIRKDHMFDKPPSKEYLEAIRLNLNEVPRVHKNKIVIRGTVKNKAGEEELKTFGSWSP